MGCGVVGRCVLRLHVWLLRNQAKQAWLALWRTTLYLQVAVHDVVLVQIA